MNKHRMGKIKREHTIIPGLLPLLQAVAECPQVQTVIPGPIEPGAGHSAIGLTFQYFTDTGCKLLGKNGDAVQEVFLVASEREAVRGWLQGEGLIDPPPPPPRPPRSSKPASTPVFDVLMHETVCSICQRPILAGSRAARTGTPRRLAYAHVRCARS